jgi:lipid II:glycine glycyltransferase (peptidoglycan interpeptide bridge formation enzyme)
MSDSIIDKFAAHPDIHQTKNYSKFMQLLGWKVVGKLGGQVFIRQIGPLRVAKIQRANSLTPDLLKQIRKDNHLLLTYVEPGINSPKIDTGWHVEPFAHSKTSLIDLTPSQDDIIQSFKPRARYNITRNSKNQKLKLTTLALSDLTLEAQADFLACQKAWSKRKHIYGYDQKHLESILLAFKSAGWLHLAYHQGECIAALLVLHNDPVATYYAAFSDPLGYKLYAPTLLTWEAIRSAKSCGATILDFGGIYDPRYPKMYKKWTGFTKFKEAFKPTAVTYPETKLLLGW